jgi:hypothetical protein
MMTNLCSELYRGADFYIIICGRAQRGWVIAVI